ncbi:MAG: helix-turn-helix transcriptional regulator [Agriterribacter sp.]
MATTTLKILREVKGYTQEQIADVLGISQNTYSRLERNPKSLTAQQAQKLADVYKVNIEDLLSEATPVLTFPQLSAEHSNNSYSNHAGSRNRQEENISDIKSLKEEVEYLRKQNFELIRALGSR